MPIYTFECNKCNKQFDLLIGVGKGSCKKICPDCKSDKIKKIISSFAVVGKSKSLSSSSSCSGCSSKNCSTY